MATFIYSDQVAELLAADSAATRARLVLLQARNARLRLSRNLGSRMAADAGFLPGDIVVLLPDLKHLGELRITGFTCDIERGTGNPICHVELEPLDPTVIPTTPRKSALTAPLARIVHAPDHPLAVGE